MPGGLTRVLLAAFVAGSALALWAPSAALACGGGGPSAVNVYTECLQTGGGDNPTNGGTTPVGGGGAGKLPVTPRTTNALAHAGKDAPVLANLVNNPSLSGSRHLASAGPETAAPSAIGSATDLGSGPTALFAVLAASAVLLLGMSGFRAWRHWRGAA